MRFLSIVKAAENQGPPPQALLDAIARTFMRLHQQHWRGWEGECEIRELCFLAP